MAVTGSKESQLDRRLSERINDDILYGPLYRSTGSVELLRLAGYIDDGMTAAQIQSQKDPRFITTPLGKIRSNLASPTRNRRRPVVLLASGCFAPVHDGHIAMMERAKAVLSERGYLVAGGFLAPAHDSYATTKDSRSSSYSAQVRINLLQMALADSAWLAVDPWCAGYNSADLNFSDMIDRLQRYLRFHLDSEIDVWFVFGSDNYNFLHAFRHSGSALCVKRPGYDVPRAILTGISEWNADDRLLIAPSSESPLASSTLRSAAEPKSGAQTSTGVYCLRDDIEWATAPWSKRCPATRLRLANRQFIRNLKANIAAALPGTDVVTLSAANQLSLVREVETKGNVINLDAVTQQERCGYSRVFEAAELQRQPLALQPRIELGQRGNDWQTIYPGHYTFIDDDVVTGSTLKHLRSELPEGVTIDKVISLAEAEYSRNGGCKRILDIVDARDFLFGSEMGGLCVALPSGRLARVPYIAPMVDLLSRASIPPEGQVAFSLRVLEINRSYFSWLPEITVDDCGEPFQQFAAVCGFGGRSAVLELIDWLQERLLAPSFSYGKSNKLDRSTVQSTLTWN